jgi:hypothetical protein
MKNKPALSILLLGIVFFPATAALGQKIETSFENVKDYRDFSVSGLSEEKSLKIFKAELADVLPRLERRFLTEGLKLHITFTDIDMAGDIQPWRNLHNADIRYVERIYPPRLKFTYQLTDTEGKVLREGEESISDLAFQMNATAAIRADNDTFFYETTLLEDWVRKTFRDLRRPKE